MAHHPADFLAVEFTPEERAALFAAVRTLKQVLVPRTVGLDAARRRELRRIGTHAEDFCGETFAVLDINRHVVPPGLGLEQALRDQRALAVVRPVLQELEPLVDRLRDTEVALGNEMLAAALEGYRVLKHVGRSHGLDGLISEFGARFVRRVRRELPVAGTPARDTA